VRRTLKQVWALRKEGRLEDAALLLVDALDQGKHPVLLSNLADVLLTRGHRQEAVRRAEEALQMDPRNDQAHAVLGRAAEAQGLFQQAAEHLKQALELNEREFYVVSLARILEKDGKVGEAIGIMQDWLEQHPEGLRVQKALSRLYSKTGKKERSEEVLALASSEDPALYAERIKMRLADLKPEEAIRKLEPLLAVGSRRNNPHLHLLLGDLYRRVEMEEKALCAYREALNLRPDDPYILGQVVYSLRRCGRKEEAWPLLVDLVKRRPQDPVARRCLERDARVLNRVEEACKVVDGLCRSHPGIGELFGLRKRLKKGLEKALG